MHNEPGLVLVDSTDDVLSSRYPAAFRVLNGSFLSAWHYVLYMKAKWLKRFITADRILAVTDIDSLPALEESLGDDSQTPWRDEARSALDMATWHKFLANADMRALLLGTGSALIVSTTHQDSFWSAPVPGPGEYYIDKRQWIGRNAEGISLMKTRDQLIARQAPRTSRSAYEEPVSLTVRISMCAAWEPEACTLTRETYHAWLAVIRTAPREETERELHALMRRMYWDVDTQHAGRAELLLWVEQELGFELPEDPALSRQTRHG